MAYGTNAGIGLRPLYNRGGSPFNGAVTQYRIASAYNTSIFFNDPVAMLSDGTIGIGVAGAPCRGVFRGCQYYTAAGVFTNSMYWPASTTVMTGTTVAAFVADDPNITFTAQESNNSGGAGTPLALTDIGLNINFYIQTGVTATGQSRTTIDNGSENTTLSLNLRLLALDPTPGNVVGNYANWLVTWNSHDYMANITGI